MVTRRMPAGGSDRYAAPEQPGSLEDRRWGGTAGNARLTALAGLLLLVLLFLEGLTIPAIRLLFVPHVFIGLLLIPPLAVKLGSVGYRFVRYYRGSVAYRAAGPPRPLLRLLAPLLVASTVGLFASGVVLLLVGPAPESIWRQLHTLFFFGWFWLMAIHVLAYTWPAARLARQDLSSTGPRNLNSVGDVMTRRGLVMGSLLLGVAIAIVALPLDSSWLHWLGNFHGDG